MAKREIFKFGDSVLTKKCRPVEKFDEKLAILLDDLKETMYAAGGVGLAAPQVGIVRRVVVIDVGDGLIELVNPEIISEEGEQISEEGCLSLPGESYVTSRPKTVKVKAQGRDGKWRIYKGSDLLAKAFCHEIDHLNGILYTSHRVYKEG